MGGFATQIYMSPPRWRRDRRAGDKPCSRAWWSLGVGGCEALRIAFADLKLCGRDEDYSQHEADAEAGEDDQAALELIGSSPDQARASEFAPPPFGGFAAAADGDGGIEMSSTAGRGGGGDGDGGGGGARGAAAAVAGGKPKAKPKLVASSSTLQV